MSGATIFEITYKSFLEEHNSKEEAQRIFDYTMYWIGSVQLNAYQMCRVWLSQDQVLDILIFSPANFAD